MQSLEIKFEIRFTVFYLKGRNFPGFNFRDFFFGHFAGINFRELGFIKDFAGINFRDFFPDILRELILANWALLRISGELSFAKKS